MDPNVTASFFDHLLYWARLELLGVPQHQPVHYQADRFDERLAVKHLNGRCFVRSNWPLYTDIFFVNFWQFIVSFLYLIFNALLSCLLVNDEFAHFLTSRKTLRVSFPEGIQRSTYFISMPFKYGIPLTVFMAILHWTVSQSIFVVKVFSFYSDGSSDPDSSVAVAAFSPAGIIICKRQFLLRYRLPL